MMHIEEDDVREVYRAMTGRKGVALGDIAHRLARVPRWLGQTIAPWSVLQHVLLCDLISEDARAQKPHDRLAVLLHDIEETITGGVPSPLKTAVQRSMEDAVRRWLWAELTHLPYPDPVQLEWVKVCDMAARWAEAHALVDPAVREIWAEPPAFDHTAHVRDLLGMTEHEQVFHFTTLVQGILADKSLDAARRRA